jgi:uncharacterized membrane protein YcfT
MSQNDTSAVTASDPFAPDERVPWFDYAKGLCILLVVMMHSTLGVGEAMAGEGFMHWAVAWARPFRMPDFFLLAGLFLARVIDRPWSTYIDRKVLHFVYFYLLWLLIQLLVRHGAEYAREPALMLAHVGHALVYPFPPLWFIYVLPLYFVVVKLARRVPAPLVFAFAVALHTLPIQTGWPAIDVFARHYFVYFLAGSLLAPTVFRFAVWVAANPWPVLLCLPVWAGINGAYAFTPSRFTGYDVLADLPIISIGLGLIGAVGVVATAALLARFGLARCVATCGRHSLVIYVAFMLPMAITRTLVVKSGLAGMFGVGTTSVIVILVALLVPLALHRLVSGTPFRFLFERPHWTRLERRVTQTTAATEDLVMANRPSLPPRTRTAGGRQKPVNTVLLRAANSNRPDGRSPGRPVRAEMRVARRDIRGARGVGKASLFGFGAGALIERIARAILPQEKLPATAVIVSPRPDRLAKALRTPSRV